MSHDSGIVMESELPWARGNPQPRNGKRGTAGWNLGQRMRPFDDTFTSDNYKFKVNIYIHLLYLYNCIVKDFSILLLFRKCCLFCVNGFCCDSYIDVVELFFSRHGTLSLSNTITILTILTLCIRCTVIFM